jgi:hypothetical protein
MRCLVLLLIIFVANPASAARCWLAPNGQKLTAPFTTTPPIAGAIVVPCPPASQPHQTFRAPIQSTPPPSPGPKPESSYTANQQRYQQSRAVGGVCSARPVVYQCKRPLALLGNTATTTGQQRLGPDVRGNPLYHQYLCVRTASGYTCGGQISAGGDLYGAGGQDNLSVYSPENCKEISSSNCVANCVSKSLASETRPKYGIVLSGTNCQEWADQAAATCVKTCR